MYKFEIENSGNEWTTDIVLGHMPALCKHGVETVFGPLKQHRKYEIRLYSKRPRGPSVELAVVLKNHGLNYTTEVFIDDEWKNVNLTLGLDVAQAIAGKVGAKYYSTLLIEEDETQSYGGWTFYAKSIELGINLDNYVEEFYTEGDNFNIVFENGLCGVGKISDITWQD